RLVLLYDFSVLGEVTLRLRLVARVVHHESDEPPIRRAIANVEHEIGFGAGEAPRLDDLGQEIGPDLHHVLAQQSHAPRLSEMTDEGQEDADEKGKQQKWPRNRPDFRARGRKHN